MYYVLVDGTGEPLAWFGSLLELARQPALVQQIREDRANFKLVRIDEYDDGIVSATSYTTTTPLPELLREQFEHSSPQTGREERPGR